MFQPPRRRTCPAGPVRPGPRPAVEQRCRGRDCRLAVAEGKGKVRRSSVPSDPVRTSNRPVTAAMIASPAPIRVPSTTRGLGVSPSPSSAMVTSISRSPTSTRKPTCGSSRPTDPWTTAFVAASETASATSPSCSPSMPSSRATAFTSPRITPTHEASAAYRARKRGTGVSVHVVTSAKHDPASLPHPRG